MGRKITNYANNQNSISLKDLRSNDSAQKALQSEFKELLDNTVLYRRKRGESEEGFTETIEKDFAAQVVEAVYNNNPHNTHLKQKLFGERYTQIFSRKMNAEKVYLACILYKIINKNSELLKDEHLRNYGLSLFFFSHILSVIMNEDELGKEMLENPREYVTTHKSLLVDTLTKIWKLIAPDINMDIKEYTKEQGGYFDYKNVFKNAAFIDHMTDKIKSAYIRLTIRDEGDSFSAIYNNYKALENGN